MPLSPCTRIDLSAMALQTLFFAASVALPRRISSPILRKCSVTASSHLRNSPKPQRRWRATLAESAGATAERKHGGAGCDGKQLLCSDGVTPLLQVVFVHPCIHWNVGNIGRTCLGLGARLHLIKPLGFSMDAAQIRRAGLDYWQYVDVHVWEDWDSFAAKNEENDMRFFTKFADSSTLDISDWKTENEYKKPVVLVFGSEVNGFTGIEKWMKLKTKRKTLAFPMVDDRFRSFNLSTTASMALWDAYKSLASEKQGV